MPNASGHGSSLGAAFIDAVAPLFLGAPRSSYKAKGSRAQFRQLERTAAGRAALEGAGVGGNRRTRAAWLAGVREPNKANQHAIAAAYDALKAGGIPAWVKTASMQITGVAAIGDDRRDRGNGGYAPLLVQPTHGRWDRIEAAMRRRHPDPDEIEELIINDLIDGDDDLASTTEPWEFPGSSYAITLG